MGVTGIKRRSDAIDLRAGRNWVDLAGSTIRSTDWNLRIRFDRDGEGKPSVLRDGEPYSSFDLTGEDSMTAPAVIVTDSDAAPHRYEVRWDGVETPPQPVSGGDHESGAATGDPPSHQDGE
jgi:hypothetical protein